MAISLGRKFNLPNVLSSQDVRARRDPRDMRFFYSTLLAVFVFTAVLFLYIWTRLTVVNTGYDISKANSSRLGLIEKNRRLKIEFVRLKSPERIERIAREDVGLSYPAGEQVIKVRK